MDEWKMNENENDSPGFYSEVADSRTLPVLLANSDSLHFLTAHFHDSIPIQWSVMIFFTRLEGNTVAYSATLFLQYSPLV